MNHFIGSREEEDDLINAYKKFKGNMDKMLQVVECSTAMDGQRFEKLIRKAIKEEAVTVFKSFETTTTTKAHQMRIEKEQTDEVDYESQKKEKKEKEKVSPSLMELIQQRSKDRHIKMNSIIESIEAAEKKDEGKGKKRKQKETDSMPSEEEFLKLQESMFKKSKSKKN